MICVIPARGGSQRFPGKNIANLFGRPIINHTIDICKASGVFSAVIVSTDSHEIADVVDSAEVCFRPEHLQGDSSETEVLKDFMDDYGFTEACRVYPFAALLTPERLCTGYYRYINNGPDVVMESVEYDHPIQRAIYDNRYATGAGVMKRTQDLPVFYHDAGTFMFTTREALDKPLNERWIEWIPVKRMDCQDVDTAEDFELLKLKYAYKHMCGLDKTPVISL